MEKQDIEPQQTVSTALRQHISAGLSYFASLDARTVVALLPSFLLHQPKPSNDARLKPSSNISTLDGLRGISCLVVLHTHWTAIVENSYKDITGYTNSHLFFHLPYVHLLWHGSAQVAIFFVLSGYVLSVKCLQQIRAQQWERFHKTIASSVFRRAIRIFLPPIIAIAICTILVRMGVFNFGRAIFDQQALHHAMKLEMKAVPPRYLPTFMGQVGYMFGAMLDLLDPNFPVPLAGRWQQVNEHLWTVPQEYYCSLGLYLVLLGTSRLRCLWRLSFHALLVLFCWFAMHYVITLFFAGMVIAELDIIWKNRQEARKLAWTPAMIETSSDDHFHLTLPVWHVSGRKVPLLTVVRASVLLFGLWVLSVPRSGAESTPGYITIFSLMPDYMPLHLKHDQVRSVGAILTVWSISNISTEPLPDHSERQPWWSTFRGWIFAALANPVSQYLGKVSFSLYIVHGLVLSAVGYSIIPFIYRLTIPSEARREALKEPSGALTTSEVAIIWTLGYIVIAPTAVWVADLFTRFVDEKCVALGRRIEDKISVAVDEAASGRIAI